ncbi:MAG: glycosyltransferase, partial [Nitrososphaeraceae archaeon]|nr:glycosyltransferase [Nitrososphaeraceae archaeon]
KIKLVIVGDGPVKSKLDILVEKLAVKENVEFKGYTSMEDKNRLISQSNAMVFPSLCEGFGLVILEAFNHSRPVIVSNVRPMSDIVNHGKTGFVLDAKDENVWANHILKLSSDLDFSSKMGKQCKQVLENNYSQTKMFDGIFSMYNDVL